MNTYKYEIKNNKRKIIHRDFLNAKTIDEAHKKLRHEFPQSLIFIIEI